VGAEIDFAGMPTPEACCVVDFCVAQPAKASAMAVAVMQPQELTRCRKQLERSNDITNALIDATKRTRRQYGSSGLIVA
jgi:hypothetical protein